MGKGREWTDEEIEYLEDKWGQVSIPGIANKLNRTIGSIKNKATKRGLTRHIHNGEYITLGQLLAALGMENSYVRIRLLKEGLPIKYKASIKKKFRIIYVDDFWEWAETHKNAINFKNFEAGALGWPEPEWVDIKRQSDRKKANTKKHTKWTESEDKQLIWLLSQYKYGYVDLARIMQRTEGAIKRRCYDLKLKERPIRADNHRAWEEAEVRILIEMWEKGYTYEDISSRLDNRSASAVRGKIERELGMYKEEVI